MIPTALFVAIAVAVALLVVAERTGPFALKALAKQGAATGFLLVALSAGATGSTYGRWILLGLALSWVGDACLLSSARGPFLAGLGSFLLGHLAYVGAFASTGPSLAWSLGTLVPLAVIAAVVWSWLRPNLEGPMIGAVAAYILAITAMAALSFGAWAGGARMGVVAIPVGAVAFFLSDLAVARDRFVAPGWTNRLWGLPLYFLGQVLLASSVAA